MEVTHEQSNKSNKRLRPINKRDPEKTNNIDFHRNGSLGEGPKLLVSPLYI